MNERLKILEMLQDGKITAEQAEKLLAVINEKKAANESKPSKFRTIHMSTGKNVKGKLKIEVLSSDGDDVRIALPLKLAMIAKNFMPLAQSYIPENARKTMDANNIDLAAVLQNLGDTLDELDEDIVNINSQDGDSVRIYIEK